MLFENLISTNKAEFIEEVDYIAYLLKIDPDWLMAVMAFESSLNPAAVNGKTGATGLIQFMPATAIELGTTVAELKAMSNLQQLDYVYKYLKPYAPKMYTFVDVYFAVFYPAAMNKPSSYKIGNGTTAAQNAIFDTDKNGVLTVGEVETYITDWVYRKTGYKFPVVEVTAKKKVNALLKWGAILVGVVGILYYGTKSK